MSEITYPCPHVENTVMLVARLSCTRLMTTIWKNSHDDVIKWKHFPRYWPFVRGIPRSPVNSPHTQRPVTRSFEVFIDMDLRLNKRLSKQWWCWWFETPSRSLWRHCNGSQNIVNIFIYPVAFRLTAANTQDQIGPPHSARGDTPIHIYVRHTLSMRIIVYNVLIHTVAGKILLSFHLHFYIFTCKSIWMQTSKQECRTYCYGFSRNGVDFMKRKEKTNMGLT